MHRFEVLGIVDEPGHCELCGTYCPARRVAVRLAESDDVAYWGVVCAAEARSGRRDSTIARQMRAEAEEAGAYDGQARPHAGRRPGTVRRQTRRAAEAAAAAVATEARIVWARVASSVPAGMTAEAAANYRYRQTGRPAEGSYLAADVAGRLARIDGRDPVDVARFARAGFNPLPEPVAA